MKIVTALLVALLFLGHTYSKCFVQQSQQDYSKWDLQVQSKESLPQNFSWGNVNGKNYLTQLKNQHIPRYCGSCWIFGATSHLSDRISVMRAGAFPEIIISPQVLLDHDFYDNGCHGGDAFMAMKWIKEHGVQEESCSQYRAEGHEMPNAHVQPVCKDCNGQNCFVPDSYHTFEISDYGAIPPGNVEAMMTEIYARGPIFCGVNSDPMFALAPFGFKGVLRSDSNGEVDHIINVVGWGVDENGVDYWLVRNSWGEFYADNGFVKVERGKNTIWIENTCGYAIPKNTWENYKVPPHSIPKSYQAKQSDIEITKTESMRRILATNESEKVAQKVTENLSKSELKKIETILTEKITRDLQLKNAREMSEQSLNMVTSTYQSQAQKPSGAGPAVQPVDWNKYKPVVVTPEPKNYVPTSSLPPNWFWGNVDGTNYLTWVINQHIPQYCGSCYAQSTLSALSDRIKIQSKNLNRVTLSVQSLLNCGIGSCSQGGGLYEAYMFAHETGVPEYGCNGYLAESPEDTTCSGQNVCQNCWGTADKYFCWEPRQYTKWYAKEHGWVTGVVDMKKELLTRGPIACSLYVSDKFYYTYKGGVWREMVDPDLMQNHGVVVVGWGSDETEGEYWIVRNSWGTYWGESGYFRLPTNKPEENLGVEEVCHWAVPESRVVNPDETSWINKEGA